MTPRDRVPVINGSPGNTACNADTDEGTLIVAVLKLKLLLLIR